MNKEILEKMEDGKDKELMKILVADAKPFVRKCDGYAVKVKEAHKIEYEDYDGQKLTLEVPEGSYIVTKEDSNYPKIVPAEEFESKNKLLEESKKTVVVKEEYEPKLGLQSLVD